MSSQMWQITKDKIENGILYSIKHDSIPLSYSEVLERWQSDRSFRKVFIDLLASSPFKAFKWETPPLSITSVKFPFECVLLNAPNLQRKPKPTAFAKYLMHSDRSDVVHFQNLANDAIMVAPCKIDPSVDYCHLGSFSESAPIEQQHALWKLVGEIALKNLTSNPKWLSTAGEGVPWLHIRLDDRPKYYGYTRYRDMA